MGIVDLDISFDQDIADIESRVHRNPWSKNVILLHLENPISVSRGIVEEDTLLAYILGQHFDNEFHILNLAVDSANQNKGLGTYLISKTIYDFREKGIKTCLLEVRPSNDAAYSLYKKLGFKTIAIRKRYYQDNLEDALVMTLELGSRKPYLIDDFQIRPFLETPNRFNKNRLC